VAAINPFEIQGTSVGLQLPSPLDTTSDLTDWNVVGAQNDVLARYVIQPA
jgi:hypothetical protein